MIKNNNIQIINSEQAMLEFGIKISLLLEKGDVVYFYGDLGTGKTTLVKGILNGLGFKNENIKSPTYTIVETYEIKHKVTVQHFDFYRLNNIEELEWIGIRDYFSNDTISLIEWPERGKGILPKSNKKIYIDYNSDENGRIINVQL